MSPCRAEYRSAPGPARACRAWPTHTSSGCPRRPRRRRLHDIVWRVVGSYMPHVTYFLACGSMVLYLVYSSIFARPGENTRQRMNNPCAALVLLMLVILRSASE